MQKSKKFLVIGLILLFLLNAFSTVSAVKCIYPKEDSDGDRKIMGRILDELFYIDKYQDVDYFVITMKYKITSPSYLKISALNLNTGETRPWLERLQGTELDFIDIVVKIRNYRDIPFGRYQLLLEYIPLGDYENDFIYIDRVYARDTDECNDYNVFFNDFGNKSTEFNYGEWKVKSVQGQPFDTVIKSGPSGDIDYRDVTFEWYGEDDSPKNFTYSYWLEGYEKGYSEFTTETSKSYKDLPSDHFKNHIIDTHPPYYYYYSCYKFHVKAKKGDKIDPTIANRSFIVWNNPPNIPTITGQQKVKTGISYEYNFSTTDKDGDDVYFKIDWGDGTSIKETGKIKSGGTLTESKTWDRKRNYTITVTAYDTIGQASRETAELKISFDGDIAINYQLFRLILQKWNFPILTRLSRLLNL